MSIASPRWGHTSDEQCKLQSASAHCKRNTARKSSPKIRCLMNLALMLKSNSVSDLQAIHRVQFLEKLHAVIAPQVQIAANMGFAGQWVYA
jgi:hypothetical protein